MRSKSMAFPMNAEAITQFTKKAPLSGKKTHLEKQRGNLADLEKAILNQGDQQELYECRPAWETEKKIILNNKGNNKPWEPLGKFKILLCCFVAVHYLICYYKAIYI